jgi:hypothetical protein
MTRKRGVVVQLEADANRMDRIDRIKRKNHCFFFILFILSIPVNFFFASN